MEPPDLAIGPRGDTANFIAETRRTLQSFPGMASEAVPETGSLQTDLESIFWYHTIDLPNGIATPGLFDHRPLVGHYGIPDDLHNKRVLDVGPWDGFWAFEFERRGGKVTTVDVEGLAEVDIPPPYREALDREGLRQFYGHGFAIAKRALGSNVDARRVSVYDLDPNVVGSFDLVHMGDVLLHLQYPTEALRRVRSVTRELAILSVPFDPALEPDAARFFGGWSNVVWWIPSLEMAAQMIADAGFSSVKLHTIYELRMPTGEASTGDWRAVFHATP